jgi:hypothetical protein
MLTGEANIGNGDDARGNFRYLLLRGGGSYDIVPRKFSAEAEWLHVDVARQRDGVLRLGATATVLPRLVLRLSRYESLAGDGDTSLLTMRGDYDLGRMTAIGGFAYGHAGTVFSQQTGSDATRVRDLFGGATFRGWTIVVTVGNDRQRIAVSRRIALPFGGSR